MFSKSYWWKITLAASLATMGWGATFGTVVSIGGHASDLALDEARGVLYIANFTANRVEVMSLSSNTIQTSINVAAQPSAVALSPDGRYLVVAHYGNVAPPASSASAITVIDLSNSAKRTFSLGSAPLGVAFGIDGLALVVTATDFLLLDPASGTTQELDTIPGLISKTLPQPAASFPPNIVAASVAASADGEFIYGFGDKLLFRYDVTNRILSPGLYTSSPALGPRAVSVSQDGSYFTAGWTVRDQFFYDIAEFGNPSGTLNIGTAVIDSARNTIYAQMPPAVSTTGIAPVLQITDSDNLTVRTRLNLPENFAGKSTLSSDGSTLYGVSDSGVLVLKIGSLGKAHRVEATLQDMVFRGNFCDRRVATQTLTITDPGGGNTAFSISSDTTGLNVNPSSGVTPATVTVTVDPNVFSSQKGTVTANLSITSGQAVNITSPVRVLINSRQPEQRGTFVDLPGKLVDLLPDPTRSRFYILRQDTNALLVYNGDNNSQVATLRTCAKPMGMAVTFDQRYLLVGCDSSHYMNVFDLETLQATQPVRMFQGDYVQSVASSSNAILAVTRAASGGSPNIHRIDLGTRSSQRLPSLGVYENKVALNSVLTASTNGASILVASSDGNVMLYDANVDSFTVSRKDFTTLGGSFAASNFNLYVVGNNLLDSSLVPMTQFDSGSGSASGFAFVDQFAFRTTAPAAAAGTQSTAPGVIQRVDLTRVSSGPSLATAMVEAPLLGSTSSAFTRTIAPLYNRSALINLTVSGFTVLPWSYDASVAVPHINKVVNAADLANGIAPGGLITLFGTQLSPVNLATAEMPLPTALADSCLTVNGFPVPILFVSPNQINAQMPFETVGNVSMILRTPGGSSDTYNVQVLPGAPGVFRSGVAGPVNDVPTIIRNSNGELVTDSDPVHRNDVLVIFLTGLGLTSPAVATGMPAPIAPLAVALTKPKVTIGGMDLALSYYGLAPGLVGVNQINVKVPANAPTGISVPLAISQGTYSSSIAVRVVE
jgi:uncharacterized protein (TIGR03437 family)